MIGQTNHIFFENQKTELKYDVRFNNEVNQVSRQSKANDKKIQTFQSDIKYTKKYKEQEFMNSSIPIYKIVVLGQGRVGKTSMTLKYVKNEFNDGQESSINACYLQKDIKLVRNNKLVKLAIWDTAGQEKYNAVAPVYYRDAVGAIVAYEIVSTQSFQKVKKWVSELREHATNKDLVIVIVGNKSDMETHRRVPKGQAQSFAKEKGIKHFLVSAKSGANINELFMSLAEQIYQARQKGTQILIGDSSRKNPRIKIQASKHNTQSSQKSKSCC